MEEKTSEKQKKNNWSKKSGNDSTRISKRIEQRSLLKDSATTTNDSAPAMPPRATGGPLLRLRKKIKEIYDTDDDDENIFMPVFDITLLPKTRQETAEDELSQKKDSGETIRIVKEQQLAGKLNTIMSTAIVAEQAGLDSRLNIKDYDLANSPTDTNRQTRKKIQRRKIEKPLGLKGGLNEKDLKSAASGIKKAKNTLPADALKDFPAQSLDELTTAQSEQDMAELILKKTGRSARKKKLFDLAKQQTNQNDTPKKTSSKQND